MTSFFHSGRSNSNRKHVQVMLLLREAGFILSSTENTPSGWNLVSLAEVQIHPASTKAFNAFSKPNIPAVESRSSGMANFYRKFIPNFAQIPAPINVMCKKGARHT